MIQESSETSWAEMFKVFNMGHRMEIYCPEEISARIIEIAKGFKVGAQVIGHCEPAENKQVEINSQQGIYQY